MSAVEVARSLPFDVFILLLLIPPPATTLSQLYIQMISFTSFPEASSHHKHPYPQDIADEDVTMTLEDDDTGFRSSSLTSPGEAITSAHAFMR